METSLNQIFIFNSFIKSNIILRHFIIKLSKKIVGMRYRRYLSKAANKFLSKSVFIDFVDTRLGFKLLVSLNKEKLEDDIYNNNEPNYSFLKVLNKIIKPGDNVFDIGSKNGFYSLYVSKLQNQQGKIYSFESDTKNFDKLLKNVFINSVTNIITKKFNDESLFSLDRANSFQSNLDEWSKVNEASDIKLILINNRRPFELIKGCSDIITKDSPCFYINFEMVNDDTQKYNLFKFIADTNKYDMFQIKKNICNKISKITHAGDLLFSENLICLNNKDYKQLFIN
jgi:tRNA A58 N-methylase Trm61